MGWAANVLLLIGMYLVGEKRRAAFLFMAVGEAIWVVHGMRLGMYDMAAICIVFAVGAGVNWWKWRKRERQANGG